MKNEDKKVLVTLSKDEHQTLKNVASALRIPMSDIVRIALKSYLGRKTGLEWINASNEKKEIK